MKSSEITEKYIKPLFTRAYWQMLGDYIGIGRNSGRAPIDSEESMAQFISSRASHVAQASLYGYLRTRAGTRFPTLFENPDLLMSINIAKWHIWLACVSDLGIYIGQCVRQSGKLAGADLRSLMNVVVRRVMAEAGEPEEAGPDFAAARERVLQRIDTHDWDTPRDDDAIFSQSPEALFYWAPIAEELKQNDESIVKNSIRYRWIDIRRSARTLLDFEALAQSLGRDPG